MICSNQAKCLKCGDEPFSMHRHDYKTCSCGNLSVNGGQSYIKRSFSSPFKELSIELDEEVVNKLTLDIEESINSGRNPYGVALAALRSLRDSKQLKGFVEDE